MNSVLTSLQECLDQEGIRYQELETSTGVRARFGGRNGMFDCVMTIDDECRAIVVITTLPLRVMAEHQPRMAQQLMSINCGLRLGAFVLDAETGLVTFETSAYFGKADAQSEFLKHLVFHNWITIDLFFPDIATMILGSRAADEKQPSQSETPANSNSPRRARTRSRLTGDSGPLQN